MAAPPQERALARNGDELRARLMWLSAQAATVQNLAYTRQLTAAERAFVAGLEDESAALLRRLASLMSPHAVAA